MTKISNQYSLTNVLFADAVNGRVGVNNASPTVALDVTGAGLFSSSLTTGGAIFTTNNTPFDTAGSITRHSVVGLALKAVTASVFDFSLYSAGGTALMTNPTGTNNINFNSGQVWFNGSNVGIGTSSPLNKFTVVGVSSFQLSEANDIRLIINPTASGINISSTYNTNGSYQPITISTSDTERMRIHPNGTKYFGAFNSSRLQINPSGEQVLSYTNNYYIWGIFNDSNSVAIESAFAGDIIFRAQAQSTSSSPTTAAERMRITSGGSLLMAKNNVIGINTADGSDDGYLSLAGASGDNQNRGGCIYLSGNERAADPGMVVLQAGNVIGVGSVITFRTGAAVERMRIIGNGRVLIGTSTDQGYLFYVNGNAAGTSGFANVSDKRLKKDITPIESALDKVKQLRGISFNWDKTLRPDLNLDDNNHLGLIAQEVEEILPQVVFTGEDEFSTKTVSYSDIVPVLIESIKELSAQVSEQQTQINELKALLNAH